MSDFAMQFIPEEGSGGGNNPFAMQFIPDGLDGRGMTMKERIAAAKNGTLAGPDADTLARIDAANAATGIEPTTNLLEQTGTGASEGIAALAGFPVDTVTAALNAGARGLGLPEIENPAGGSNTFKNVLSPFMSDMPPQNAGQRYGRRVGQEVGFGLPIGMLAGGGSLATAGYNALADTVSGISGQTAREVLPESNTADMVASLAGGIGTAAGIGRLTRSRPPAPYDTTQEMFDESGRVYGSPANGITGEPATGLHASNVELTRPAQQEMLDNVFQRMQAERASPRLHPKSYGTLEESKNWPNARLTDIDETRRAISRDVVGNADESAVGLAMKNELDSYVDNLDATKTVGGVDPSADVLAQKRARDLFHQASKAQDIEFGTGRAANRAARSGRGGNEINTMRQNIGKVLDKEVYPLRPGQRSGYTPDEIAQMEAINAGTPALNLGRHIAGMSPTTGALPMMGSVGAAASGITGSALTGNPLMAAAGMTPAATGMIAKWATERATRKQIEELMDIIRRGGTQVEKQTSSAAKRALLAQILSGTAPSGPQ